MKRSGFFAVAVSFAFVGAVCLVSCDDDSGTYSIYGKQFCVASEPEVSIAHGTITILDEENAGSEWHSSDDAEPTTFEKVSALLEKTGWNRIKELSRSDELCGQCSSTAEFISKIKSGEHTYAEDLNTYSLKNASITVSDAGAVTIRSGSRNELEAVLSGSDGYFSITSNSDSCISGEWRGIISNYKGEFVKGGELSIRRYPTDDAHGECFILTNRNTYDVVISATEFYSITVLFPITER